MYACEMASSDSWDLVDILVDAKADVLTTDLTGKGPLDYNNASHRLLKRVIDNEASDRLTAGHPAMIEVHRRGHDDLMKMLREKSGRTPKSWSCLSQELIQTIVNATVVVTRKLRTEIRAVKGETERPMMPIVALCTASRMLNRTFVSMIQQMPTSGIDGLEDADCCGICYDSCGNSKGIRQILMYQPIVKRAQCCATMMKNAIAAQPECGGDCMYMFEEEYFEQDLVPELCKAFDTRDKAMQFFRLFDQVPSSKVPSSMSRLEFIHQQHVGGSNVFENYDLFESINLLVSICTVCIKQVRIPHKEKAKPIA